MTIAELKSRIREAQQAEVNYYAGAAFSLSNCPPGYVAIHHAEAQSLVDENEKLHSAIAAALAEHDWFGCRRKLEEASAPRQ